MNLNENLTELTVIVGIKRLSEGLTNNAISQILNI